MENTGVMPLPPAHSRKSPCSEPGTKMPAGAITSSFCPALRLSHSQFEPRPPCTRFTVTRSQLSSVGALDIE